MTESPFAFGSAPETVPPAEQAEAGRRRNLLLGGALAVVLLAGGATFLLGGGDEVVEDAAFTPAPRRPAAVATTAPTPITLPVTQKVASGDNPFKALYVQPAGGAADPTGAAGPVTTTPDTAPADTPTGSTPTGSAPVVVPAPDAPPGTFRPPAPVPFPPAAPVPAPGGGSAPAPAPQPVQSTVALLSVSTRSGKPVGTFELDGVRVTGGQGAVLAGRLLVVSLQQDLTGSWFANLKRASGSPFEVHQNQTVLVE